MTFANGYHPLPPGKIAAVVTYLEMLEQPARLVLSKKTDLAIQSVPTPGLDWYKQLFRSVGEEWLWFSRLTMGDDALGAIIHDPKVEVYVLRRGSEEVGLLELDFRNHDACELAYFGLTAEVIGSGAAQHLMQFAIDRVWSDAHTVRRFHVHTCTLDHPRAISFYQRCGFTPYARAIEIADDPRLDGRLSRDVANWLPLL